MAELFFYSRVYCLRWKWQDFFLLTSSLNFLNLFLQRNDKKLVIIYQGETKIKRAVVDPPYPSDTSDTGDPGDWIQCNQGNGLVPILEAV